MTRFTHTTQELCNELKFSLSTLRRYKNGTERVFFPGRHYIPIGIGKKRPNLRWDPEEVSKTLELKARREGMK